MTLFFLNSDSIFSPLGTESPEKVRFADFGITPDPRKHRVALSAESWQVLQPKGRRRLRWVVGDHGDPFGVRTVNMCTDRGWRGGIYISLERFLLAKMKP